MRISIAALLITGLTLSGCSSWQGSRVNPTNWFGKSKNAPVAASEDNVNALIPKVEESVLFTNPDDGQPGLGVPVDSVTELKIEQTPSGAIIRATGLGARQGAHNVQLVLNEGEDSGTLDYAFRATYPEYATPVGTEQSRVLQVAISMTHQDLAGIKLIRVSSETNARETRR